LKKWVLRFYNNSKIQIMATKKTTSGKKNWIKINPKHVGDCTPLSNPKCTGHKRAFAIMMKKNHGFHKSK